jgi:hypothetical protein
MSAFCRLGKPISRHAGSTGVRDHKLVQISVQVPVLDLREVASIECGNALLDGHAQLVELERFLGMRPGKAANLAIDSGRSEGSRGYAAALGSRARFQFQGRSSSIRRLG